MVRRLRRVQIIGIWLTTKERARSAAGSEESLP
jgi:hypothetical protein